MNRESRRWRTERLSFAFLPGLPIVVEPKATLKSSDAGILPIRPFDDQIAFIEHFVAAGTTRAIRP